VRRLFIAVPALLSACVVSPVDPFERAEHELARCDLLRALQAFDTVPITHARYPDARAAADEVERQIRRCHELVLEALELRSEWRDREALARLRLAREEWPSAPSLDDWIAVIEQRITTFTDDAPATGASELVASADAASRAPTVAPAREVDAGVPAIEPSSEPSSEPSPAPAAAVELPPPPAPVAETAPRRSRDSARSEPREGSPSSRPPVASVQPRVDVEPRPQAAADVEPVLSAAAPSLSAEEIDVELAGVERLLERGERQRAVVALDALARACPAAVRVTQRLASLLQQRALLHYGSGRVDAALADWRRILELQPDNHAVRQLCDRAVAESAARAGR